MADPAMSPEDYIQYAMHSAIIGGLLILVFIYRAITARAPGRLAVPPTDNETLPSNHTQILAEPESIPDTDAQTSPSPNEAEPSKDKEECLVRVEEFEEEPFPEALASPVPDDVCLVVSNGMIDIISSPMLTTRGIPAQQPQINELKYPLSVSSSPATSHPVAFLHRIRDLPKIDEDAPPHASRRPSVPIQNPSNDSTTSRTSSHTPNMPRHSSSHRIQQGNEVWGDAAAIDLYPPGQPRPRCASDGFRKSTGRPNPPSRASSHRRISVLSTEERESILVSVKVDVKTPADVLKEHLKAGKADKKAHEIPDCSSEYDNSPEASRNVIQKAPRESTAKESEPEPKCERDPVSPPSSPPIDLSIYPYAHWPVRRFEYLANKIKEIANKNRSMKRLEIMHTVSEIQQVKLLATEREAVKEAMKDGAFGTDFNRDVNNIINRVKKSILGNDAEWEPMEKSKKKCSLGGCFSGC